MTRDVEAGRGVGDVGGAEFNDELEWEEWDGTESRCPGLRRSREMTDGLPLWSMVKCFAERFRMRKGPIYGGCNGFRTASHLTNACEQLESLSLTYVCRCRGCLVGTAEMSFIVLLSRSTYDVTGIKYCSVDPWSKNSPGK